MAPTTLSEVGLAAQKRAGPGQSLRAARPVGASHLRQAVGRPSQVDDWRETTAMAEGQPAGQQQSDEQRCSSGSASITSTTSDKAVRPGSLTAAAS